MPVIVACSSAEEEFSSFGLIAFLYR